MAIRGKAVGEPGLPTPFVCSDSSHQVPVDATTVVSVASGRPWARCDEHTPDDWHCQRHTDRGGLLVRWGEELHCQVCWKAITEQRAEEARRMTLAELRDARKAAPLH